MFKRLPTWLLVVSIFLFSCEEEIVPDAYRPKSNHDRYWYSLKIANLLNTAIGKEWEAAANYPFDNQHSINLPYKEAFSILPREPGSAGYRFAVKRGQKINVELDLLSEDSLMIFMDLFRVINDSLGNYRHVASGDTLGKLAFEPRQDATYLLRVQPELLRGGNFSITIYESATLGFPVAGKNVRAIQSFFGDPRDGGRREHHGVDIFARRHTPIIAPTEAYVRFVGVRGLGGNVIWLRDQKRGHSLYFAHLQEQLVESNTYVMPGDTIGTVGNTGNARYTPPHLHFGIYSNGPINPFHFIVNNDDPIPEVGPDLTILGKRFQFEEKPLVRLAKKGGYERLDTLAHSGEIAIMGINDNYIRVKSDNGKEGFLSRRSFDHSRVSIDR